MFKKIKAIPGVLILLAIWSMLRLTNADLNQNFSIAIFLAAMVVMAIEFFKSGDIGLKSFGCDLAFSVLALMLYSAVETIIVMKGYPFQIVDVLMGLVVVADGWISPMNSFKTALRNFGVGGNAQTPGE